MGASKGPCRSVGIDPEGVKHNCSGTDGQHGHYCGCGLVWGADGRAVSREGIKTYPCCNAPIVEGRVHVTPCAGELAQGVTDEGMDRWAGGN